MEAVQKELRRRARLAAVRLEIAEAASPEIVAELFLALRDLYKKEGGAFPDPVVKLPWPYKIPRAPAPDDDAPA